MTSDRRTTRIRSDVKPFDAITNYKGWHIPSRDVPEERPTGIYVDKERIAFVGFVTTVNMAQKGNQ